VKLVLFDIDGTLLATEGAGKRAVTRALKEIFGSTGPDSYHFDGKTDPQIVRELMRLAGHGDEVIDERMERMLDRYVAYLHDELMKLDGKDDKAIDSRMPAVLNLYVENLNYELRAPDKRPPRMLGGVAELLDALEARGDVILGLLTGNIERGARMKLDAVGIEFTRFRVGAYGSDHERRPQLPAIARERCRRQTGVFLNGAEIVVIGDTPDDLSCGRSLGANAIGVATGRFSVPDLMEHKPFAAFEDLTDTQAVVEAILR
jgi:phosphoglycolate phosphatase-like HAD superfamily hydrolase